MKKLLALSALACFCLVTLAQETSPWKIKAYGFIRNDFYYESRANYESAAGLFGIMPKDVSLNTSGEDLNDVSTAKMLAIASRLGVDVVGAPMLGAKTSARLEGDYCGFSSSTTMLRIRQAWAKLDWGKSALTVGQSWHPMFGDVVPTVAGINTGSPFQPFNASPQMRVDYRAGNCRITAAAIYQLQYNTTGPNGSSTEYLTNGKIPEVWLGFGYRNANWKVDAGADFLSVVPRTVDANNLKVDERVNALSFMASASYKKGNLEISAKTILGENNSHLLMISGYGVTGVKHDGKTYEYAPLRNTTSWVNVLYGKTWQFGVFAGYMKNLGTADPLLSASTTYVFSSYTNIDDILRVAPLVQYNLGKLLFTAEYECTAVHYGNLNLETGRVNAKRNIVNNRYSFVTTFFF